MDAIDPHNAQEIFFDGIHEVKTTRAKIGAQLRRGARRAIKLNATTKETG